MPTYEYACSSCGHQFEQFQSITAEPLKRCPACQKNALNRLLGTGGGIIFRGAGFYQTDYRSDSYKQAAKAESPAPAGSAATGGEAKPDTTGSSTPAPASAPSPDTGKAAARSKKKAG